MLKTHKRDGGGILPITLQSNPFFIRYRCSACGDEFTQRKRLPRDPIKLREYVGKYLADMTRP